jgi:RNA 2',3'-cyclic 3'-phosphodiesterase
MPERGGSAPSSRRRRLFVAIRVPPGVRAAVEAAFAPWRDAFPAARWVPPANWHVTVRFVGPVPAAMVDRVTAAVGEAAASAAPFRTRLRTIGAFPSPRRAKVLWAGLEDDEGGATGLARALDASLAMELPVPTRAFRPHVTVARCDPPLALPASFTATPIAPVGVRVDRVVLFESIAGGPSVRYEPVATFSLRG